MKHELQFNVLPDIHLTNDFIVRREVLDELPIPLGLIQQGEWVWWNKAAALLRQMSSEDFLDVAKDFSSEIENKPDRYSASKVKMGQNHFVTVQNQPVRNLIGETQGRLVWIPEGLGYMVANSLVTAVFIARERDILWANAAALRLFGEDDLDKRWDDIDWLPTWDQINQPDKGAVLVHRVRDVELRLFSYGPYVLCEGGNYSQIGGDAVPAVDFASFVHEIRNPLGALSGYIELCLHDDKTSAPVTEHLTHALEEVARLSRLTSDMMWLGRPLSMHLQETSLAPLVDQAWQAAGETRVRLTVTFSPDQTILVDPDRFRQILINLFKNSIEAMDQNGDEVIVTCEREKGQQVVTVSDNGPGMSADLLRGLFVRRYTTKRQGSGLGFFIVKRLIEAHGGTIGVRSGATGTSVEMRLPEPVLD